MTKLSEKMSKELTTLSQRRIPNKIKIDDPVNIAGHSLKGKKSTLKPVKRDRIDSAFNIPKESQ